MVVKVNSIGAIQWQKSLGGALAEQATSIQQTPDSGFIVAGFSSSSDGDITSHHGSTSYDDFWVVKLTAAGDIQWQKSLGGSIFDEAYCVRVTNDGGYIIVGYSYSNDGDITGHHGSSIPDSWVVKLTATGTIEWQKSLGGADVDLATSVDLTPDGGFIVAGFSRSTHGDVTGNHGGADYWLVKLNSTGNIQWQKCLGGSGDERANAVQVTADGGYIVAGNSRSTSGDVTGNHGNSDFWVVKLNSTGTIEWQKCLGGTGDDEAYSVQAAPDGGYVIAGNSNSTDGDAAGNHGGADLMVVKLNSAGDKLWQKSLGGTGNEGCSSISTAHTGGYILAGGSTSNNGDVRGNHGSADGWVVKIKADTLFTIAANTSTNICSGVPVTFTANTPALVSPTYQWKKNNINVGTNSNIYKDSTLANGDSVFCVVSFTSGVDTSNAIHFTTYANYHPIISIRGRNAICDGQKVLYQATVSNAGTTYHLQWKKNGIDVGSDSLSYTTAG